MRGALLALGCYAAYASAEVADVLEDASSSVSSAAAAASNAVVPDVALPAFTPTTLKAPFLEQFTDDWESRWKASHAKKEDTEEEWQYVGTWSVEEPIVYKGISGDKGLVLKDKAAHHAISAKFDKPINNKGKTLVVQYEVKLQANLECGGAYLKLLQDNAALKSDEFSNASPYVIMFGPDKCGSTNKVHFIFRHKNPKTGEYEEKHMDAAPPARITKQSSLYTLVVRPDQTFELSIDGESVKNGTLLDNFSPPVNPIKEIDDPEDKKPEDWVDNEKMSDPDEKKPADWDDDAPYEVEDEDAVKPDDWLENEPAMVPDPEAEKPDDWDDEEDGDFQPPLVSNPKCDDASGCGPWKRPMKKNPNFKGKWMAKLIPNPLYKGLWAARKILNPAWFEDKTPSDFEPLGGIGFELWTMNEDILFDNIYIGHSEADAKKLQAETFDVKKPIEKQAEDAAKPKDEKPATPKSPNDLVFLDDPVLYIKEKTQLFYEIFQRSPIEAVKFVPEVAGAIGVGALTLLVVIISALSSSAAPSKQDIKATAKKAQDSAVKAKDQVANAVASGTEQVKDEVNKRTGRTSNEL